MMEEYWKYIKGNEQIMKNFFMAVIEAIEDMKKRDKFAYYSSYFTVHESIFGKHFNEELAKKAVSEMKNADGTIGEHWTLQQTSSLESSNGVSYDKYDFYYVMNMLYSDFCEVIGNDASTYFKLAKAYMDDPDASKDKAYCLWKARFFD
jgi:hypothetical protein